MCGGFHDAAGGDILIDHKVLEGYLRKLYGGKFDVSKEIEPTIWREVLRLLNEATVEGLSQSQLPPTHEQEFYKELRHSNEVFAAFKVHKMGSLMALKLTDEDGKLKSYRQWKEDIKGISNHFLNAWLKTEYNTAVIRAHNAADWRQFERNKDIMPNLRWMPTVSPNPEAEHRVFWERKLTRPIDDPFWNKHRPGNRWNCKCSLEATDDPITPLPTEAEIRGDQPQRGLENNPGKDGQLFSKKHPYFPKNCRECGFNKRKGVVNFLEDFFNNGGVRCEQCDYYLEATNLAKSEVSKWKEQLPPKSENYINLYKGQVWASPHHGEQEWADNENLARFLASKLNKKIYMLPRLDPNDPHKGPLRDILLPPGIPAGKSPDYLIGGKTFDGKSMLDIAQGKSVEAYRRSIQKRIKDGKLQADNIILEIPDFVSKTTIKSAIKGYFGVSNKSRIIIVKHGENIYMYKKHGG